MSTNFWEPEPWCQGEIPTIIKLSDIFAESRGIGDDKRDLIHVMREKSEDDVVGCFILMRGGQDVRKAI